MTTPEEKALQEAHPGFILRTEFLEPKGISKVDLVRRTGIPASRWTEITKGRRRITAKTALALGMIFKMDPWFWLNLQSSYDLRIARLELEENLQERAQPLKT